MNNASINSSKFRLLKFVVLLAEKIRKTFIYRQAHHKLKGLCHVQWRSEAKRHPGPTIKVPPSPPLKFAHPHENLQ